MACISGGFRSNYRIKPKNSNYVNHFNLQMSKSAHFFRSKAKKNRFQTRRIECCSWKCGQTKTQIFPSNCFKLMFIERKNLNDRRTKIQFSKTNIKFLFFHARTFLQRYLIWNGVRLCGCLLWHLLHHLWYLLCYGGS